MFLPNKLRPCYKHLQIMRYQLLTEVATYIAELLKILQNYWKLHSIHQICSWWISIDGLPITKSSNKQLWPILGRCQALSEYPFPIGIYYGLQPKSSSDYVKQFVDEMIDIFENGISFQNKIFSLQLNAFVLWLLWFWEVHVRRRMKWQTVFSRN